MKKIVNLCLILAVGVMASSCNCFKKMAKNVDDVIVTCNPEVLTLKGNNIITDVTVSFPEKYYNKKAVAKVTPVLEFEGGSIVGTPQYFQGSKVKDNYIVIDQKMGGSYTMSVSFPYDPRAEVSTLVMVIEGRCNKETEMTEVARIPVAEGVNTLQNKMNYTSALELMSDKYEKTTTISEKANIMYTINQSNVRKNQLTTEQIKALEAFITENVDKDRVTLGSVYANGYASPDGPLALNDKLSKARSESGQKALKNELKKVDGVSYDAAAYGEDWQGFKELVEASNIEDKAMILQILQMTSNPAERDAQIKNMSAVFEQLAKEVLPQLRRTQLVATAEVQNLTDAEIVAAIERGEMSKLSLEQLLYGATLINDNAAKAKVYAAAATTYNDARAYNNLGVVNAQMGNWAEASKAFSKASSLSSDAAINNNLAVGALAEGKIAEAKQYIAGASAEAQALAAVAEGNYAAANGKLSGYNAAVNYVLEGNMSAAKSALAGDKSADAEYLRAVIASLQGNVAEAKAYLKSAIEKNPAMKTKAAKDVNLKALLK